VEGVRSLIYADLPRLKVHIRPAQPAQFGSAQPAEDRDQDDGPPAARGGSDDSLQLGLGGRDGAGVFPARQVQLDPCRRIDRRHAAATCFAKYSPKRPDDAADHLRRTAFLAEPIGKGIDCRSGQLSQLFGTDRRINVQFVCSS
jgi:hypothetical protein